MNFLSFDPEMLKPKNNNCTCVYAIVFEIVNVIVSKEVFTNLKKIERKNDYNKESVKQGQTWLAATF